MISAWEKQECLIVDVFVLENRTDLFYNKLKKEKKSEVILASI
jgi:hypothetical protein